MTAGPAVLPQRSRLRHGREISAVSRGGARAQLGDLSVSLRSAAPTSGPVRGCVVVGKRSGGAVARNRQRRRLQHALAELLPDLAAGTDVVVRGGPAVHELSSVELRRDLRRALSRATQRAERSAQRPSGGAS